MNSLERRLADTEQALFFALVEIHDGEVVDAEYDSRGMKPSVLSGSTPTTQQEKAEVVDEWARIPLANRAQAQAWLRSKQAGVYAVNNLNSLVDQPMAESSFDITAPSPAVATRRRRRTASRSTREEPGQLRPGGDAGHPDIQQDNLLGSIRPKRGHLVDGGSPSHHPAEDLEVGRTVDQTPDVLKASRASSFAEANKTVYF